MLYVCSPSIDKKNIHKFRSIHARFSALWLAKYFLSAEKKLLGRYIKLKYRRDLTKPRRGFIKSQCDFMKPHCDFNFSRQ